LSQTTGGAADQVNFNPKGKNMNAQLNFFKANQDKIDKLFTETWADFS
jgi:hypothetical protein